MRIRANSAPGFSLVELLVGIVIVSILATLITAATRNVMARSRSTACLANLRQIGVGLQSYLVDHNGELPAMKAMRASRNDDVPVMDTVLASYTGGTDIFRCPAERRIWEASGSSYWWYETVTLKPTGEHNYRSVTLESFFLGTDQPSRIPLVIDKEAFHPEPRKINALYADGHSAPLADINPNATP